MATKFAGFFCETPEQLSAVIKEHIQEDYYDAIALQLKKILRDKSICDGVKVDDLKNAVQKFADPNFTTPLLSPLMGLFGLAVAFEAEGNWRNLLGAFEPKHVLVLANDLKDKNRVKDLSRVIAVFNNVRPDLLKLLPEVVTQATSWILSVNWSDEYVALYRSIEGNSELEKAFYSVKGNSVNVRDEMFKRADEHPSLPAKSVQQHKEEPVPKS